MKKLTAFAFLIICLFTAKLSAEWEYVGSEDFSAVKAVAVNHLGDVTAAAAEGFFFTANGGSTWRDRSEGLGIMEFSDILADKFDIYLATLGDGIQYSNNDGKDWIDLSSNIGDPYISAVVKGSDGVYAAGDNGVHKTITTGQEWVIMGSSIIQDAVYAITVDGDNIYAGTVGGNLYRSADGGITWNDLTQGQLSFDIYAIYAKDDVILCGTRKGGVFGTVDGGENWNYMISGMTTFDVTSIVGFDEAILLSTESGGVYFSENGGASWILINEGMQSAQVADLAVGPDYVYAATKTSGVYRRAKSDIAAPEIEPPVLLAPADGAVDVVLEPRLQWQSSNGAVSYSALLSDDDAFSNVVFDEPYIENTFVNVETLQEGTTYYWKIAANTPDDEKKWSEVRSFTTLRYLTPLVVYPPDEETDVPLKPTFEWEENENAIGYAIRCYQDEELTEEVFDEIGLTEGSYVPENDLQPGFTYFWQCAAFNESDDAFWTAIHSFTTASLYTPVVLTPADGATEVDLKPTFSWEGREDVASYSIRCYEDQDMTVVAFEESGLTETSYVPEEDLMSDHEYGWMCGALDAESNEYWTQINRFTTKSTQSVFEFVTDPSEINAYPNPASDKVVLEFAGAKKIDKIVVSGISGVDRAEYRVDATSARVGLDVSSLPAGAYMLTVYAEGEILVRKIVVE